MTQNGSAAFARLSTDGLPERAGLDACREFFGSPHIGLDFQPHGQEPLRAEVKLWPLPEIALGTVNMRGGRFERTRQAIAADGKDDFALSIVTRGWSSASQRGRELQVTSGGAVLTTDADWASVSFPFDMQFLILQPSREALSALVSDLDDLVTRPIPRDNEALRLLTSYAAMAQTGEALATPELRHSIATHLLDLVALTIGASRDAAAIAEGRGLRAARLRAIKADIAARLTHHDLSIGRIAARHRITPRYIAKLFEGEGTSFTEFVRSQRLERARRVLVDPRSAGVSITAIAFEVGFGDLSYFNRCFRQRYGASPSDIREAARQTRLTVDHYCGAGTGGASKMSGKSPGTLVPSHSRL